MKKTKAFFDEHNINSTKGLVLGGTVSISALLGMAFLETGWMKPVSFCVGAMTGVVGMQLVYLVLKLIGKLVKKLLGWNLPLEFLDGLTAFVASVASFGIALGVHCEGIKSYCQLALVALFMGLVWESFFFSGWMVLRRRFFTWFTILLFVLSLTGSSASVYFLYGNGRESGNLATYEAWAEAAAKENSGKKVQETEGFSESIAKGNARVETIYYGTGGAHALESETYDVTPFITGYEGIKEKLRQETLGYALSKVPLSGVIYYPVEAKNCPVVFLAHGQHSMVVDSYLGYEYLGEYLASEGYVVVSVNENALNAGFLEAVSSENDARALLLLENIKQVEKYNQDPENPMYGTMDYENIALAGHSRGGETIAIAALLNQYDKYPGNGQIHLNYDFSIKSLLAIAPTSDQYKPAGHSVALCDVNYLVLQGANDEDVTEFQGKETYDRIQFTGEKECFKSSLYIAGANHGQFNTLWGKFDQPWPLRLGLNTNDFISEPEQKLLLMTYAKIYLDCTLKEECTYQSLFYDYGAYQEFLPQTVYVQSYSDSTREVLCDFEEDSNLETATNPAVVKLETTGMRIWNEKMLYYDPEQERENHGLYLEWKKGYQEPKLNLVCEELDFEGKNLQFDLCSLTSFEGAKVVFQDSMGRRLEGELSDHGAIHPPIPVTLTKIQALFEEKEYRSEMQTQRISMSELLEKSQKKEPELEFDLQHLQCISIVFTGQSGKVYIDNIEVIEEK